MKKKIILLVLVVLLLLSFVLTACSGDKIQDEENLKYTSREVEERDIDDKRMLTVEDIKSKGKLVMGTNADYPPFEFHAMIDGGDEIVGLDIEIAKYIADSLGVELEIKDMNFSNLLGAVSTGMVDVVLAAMYPEPEREKQVSFSDVYYEADIAVLIRKDDDRQYSSKEDLIGKTIAVQIGTTQENIANDIESTDVKSLVTNSDTVMNLKTGKVDCALLELVVAESFAKVNDDVKVVEEFVIETGFGGIAIATQKENEELVNTFNQLIREMKEKDLISQWFTEAEELSGKALK